LFEVVCRLKVLDEFLDSLITTGELGEENIKKLQGMQLIVEDVAKNIMKYREEYLEA
jgi:hypothetical protein